MKALALIVNILFLIALLPSGMMAITSPMIFDSGASKRTWALFACAIILPIFIIIAQFFAWKAYNRGDYTAALQSHLLPLVPILILVVLFTISDKLT